VLSGRLAVWADGTEQVAEPGAFLLVPRGVPHAARRMTDEPVRMLTLVSPSGLQRFFESVVREGEEELLAHPEGWPPSPPSSAARSSGITRTCEGSGAACFLASA
jgi:Cupin domain